MREFGAPPPPPTFFERLKEGLAKSAGTLGLGDILKKKLDADTLQALEEALIRADMGVKTAHEITQAVAKGRYDEDISPFELRSVLASEIARVLKPVESPLEPDPTKKPFVVLVAGVNGTGKTTTIGKIAAKMTKNGKKVVLAAGDTFRAAAIEQLQIWGKRAERRHARATGADAAGTGFRCLG